MRRIFKAYYKLKVVHFAENNSIRKTAKRFTLDRKTVKYWIRKKEDLKEMVGRRQRSYCVSKRTGVFPDLEKKLFKFIIKKRSRGICLSSLVLTQQALSIAEKKNIENFKGNKSI